MVMSPLDLRNQEFQKAFRGYSEDEVDSFLEVICEDYETIFRENISLKEQLSQKDESMWKYRDIEETLKSTLVLAQKTAEDVRNNAETAANSVLANANREAELVLKEASRQADMVIKEAQNKSQSILEEYSDLQKQARMFKANLRSTLQAQLEMLQEQSAINQVSFIQESVAATRFTESDLADTNRAQNIPGQNSVAENDVEKDVAEDDVLAGGLSEDTMAFEAVRYPQDGLLKEPRYNPGSQGE